MIAHGENVGSGEMATPLDYKDARPVSAVHNLDEADQMEHVRVFLTVTSLFPVLNIRIVLVKIVGSNDLRALETVIIEPEVMLPGLCVLFSAGKLQVHDRYSENKTPTGMSPARLKSSGEEVSSPPNTPGTDKPLELIHQKDESRLESVDKSDANRKSGGYLESNRPVEFQVTQTRESDTLERDSEPIKSNKKRENRYDLVNRSQETIDNAENLRHREERSYR